MPSPAAASTQPPFSAPQGPTGDPGSVQLEVVRGRTRQRFRPLPTGIVLVGSAPGCDLVLAAPELPELHSFLQIHPDGLSVCHLGQAPSLLVNGHATARTRLAAGDRIGVGPFVFVVHGPRQGARQARPQPPRPLTAPTGRPQCGEALAQTLLADIRAARAQSWSTVRLYTAPEALDRDDVLSCRMPPAPPEALAAASSGG